jgi:hypothetical protein
VAVKVLYKDKACLEISRYITRHLLFGQNDLAKGREDLLLLLADVKTLISDEKEIPPLLLLEIFLLSHQEKLPPLSFIQDWLYVGLFQYYISRGKTDNGKPQDLSKLMGLKLKSKHTIFTKREISIRQGELAFKVHFLHIVGALSVTDAINKVIAQSYGIDFQSLKDVYYKHNAKFEAWEELFIENKDNLSEKLSLWGL